MKNTHETKHTKDMDQVGGEAADLYWAHLGAAYRADQMKEMSNDAETLLLKNFKGLGGLALAEGIKANEYEHIDNTVLRPSVDAGAEHFQANADAYHRLAKLEDYDRSRITTINVVAAPDHAEQVNVRIDT